MLPASLALIVFPFCAACLYAVAALALKRAGQHGVDIWQAAFVANCVSAACYAPALLLDGPPIRLDLLWQPGLIALCLLGGMTLQLIALNRGDASVAVPAMGLKVLIVAFTTPLVLGETVPPMLWAAALLSVAGITFLNVKDKGSRGDGVAPALLAGSVAALFFGMFDVLVQKWGPSWGASRLLPLVFGLNAGLSAFGVAGFRTPLTALPRAAWAWLIGGSLFLAVQSIFFVACVAVYGAATAANIIYASRGLITVLLVWTVGHWFANLERDLGPRILACRVLGALSMLAAIGLVVSGVR